LVIEHFVKEPFEKYNYEKIVSKGKTELAKIKEIVVRTNVTFNGINPRIIIYEYSNGNALVIDKFQTVDLEGIDSIRKNNIIKVSVLNGESIMLGIQPYSFPMKILWMVPLIFFIVGIPLFLIGHFAGVRNFKNRQPFPGPYLA